MQEMQVQSLGQEDPGEGNGSPLQCSCLGNPMDGGAWRATAHGVNVDMTEWLSRHARTVSMFPVTQSCPALCDPVDCSPPGSSVHGSLQARILEWVAISSTQCIYVALACGRIILVLQGTQVWKESECFRRPSFHLILKGKYWTNVGSNSGLGRFWRWINRGMELTHQGVVEEIQSAIR